MSTLREDLLALVGHHSHDEGCYARDWLDTGDDVLSCRLAYVRIDPADLALVLDVAAAAVRWYESTAATYLDAVRAEGRAAAALTPGARALLTGSGGRDE